MPAALIQDLAIFGAGIAAGMINVIVGSGTLITFPTLLACGFPPVLANVSNNLGLVPGSLSGAWGYRAELRGQRGRVVRLGIASVCGGAVGAILLLTLPAGAFGAIVPVLIGIALIMVLLQPRLAKWVAARKVRSGASPLRPVPVSSSSGGPASGEACSPGPGGGAETAAVAVIPARADAATAVQADAGGPLLWFLVFCSGVYGGYFGAAQGVLLIGMLGVALDDSLQRINGVKNVLAALVNGVAAIVFVIVSHIAWVPAIVIAVGSVIGGQIGAKVGRKLPPWAMRAIILCVGIAALIKLLA